jgi:hypothetical protein
MAPSNNSVPERLKRYKGALTTVLSLIAASILLFPNAIQAIREPVYFNVWFYAYVIFSCLAFVLLATAFYTAAVSTSGVPIRRTGIGNLCALAALLSFAIFIFANMVDDRRSRPRIVSLTASNYSIEPGAAVGLTGEAKDDDGDDLAWEWRVQWTDARSSVHEGRLPSDIKNASLTVPLNAREGALRVTARVRDDRTTSKDEAVIILIRKEPQNDQPSKGK